MSLSFQTRIHVTRGIRASLADAVCPTAERIERLALLIVRFVSEYRRDVVVGVGIVEVPGDAYVDGDAAANFDTRWLVHRANGLMATNAGFLLVHSHGGRGTPRFSGVDECTNERVVRPLAIGVDTAPYGAMVLSDRHQSAVLAHADGLAAATVVIVPDWRPK